MDEHPAPGAVTVEHPGLVGRPIYLDYNATTPVDPRVVEAMLPFLVEGFGNPSSSHAYGAEPKRVLDDARARLASLVGARPSEIVFTGSGSEANQLALRGSVLAGKPRRLVTQASEHPSVLATADALRRLYGVEVTILGVDGEGLLDPADLDELLSEAGGKPAIVSVMAANNETGALQPIRELADVAHRWGALLHCDAAQAAGKIGLTVDELGVDLMTVVGHKMYAPKGIAALYVRDGIELEPVCYGGGQERGLRAGTENVAYAVAFGAAADLAASDLAAGSEERLRSLRDRLHERLETGLPGRVRLNGPPDLRLPNTLNVSIDNVDSQRLLAETPEVAASTGSACHSGATTPSPVLTAMGMTPARAATALRLSLGRWSTAAEIDQAAQALIETSRALS